MTQTGITRLIFGLAAGFHLSAPAATPSKTPPSSATPQVVALVPATDPAGPRWNCQRFKQAQSLARRDICLEAADAADALRQLKASSQEANAQQTGTPSAQPTQYRLVFLPGIHRLSSHLLIEWTSAHTGGPLILEGLEGKETILSGASVQAASIATPLQLAEAGIPPTGHSKVQVAQLPPSIPVEADAARSRKLGFGKPPAVLPADFFLGDQRLSPTIWPEQGSARLADSDCKTGGASVQLTHPAEGSFRATGPLHNAMVRGFFNWDWAQEHIPIAGAQPSGQATTLELKEKPQFGMKCGAGRLQIVNLPQTLNREGLRYFDRANRQVFFWPASAAPTPGHAASAALEIAVAEGLLRIEKSDHLQIQHLEFRQTRGDGIVVSDSRDVVFRQVAVKHTGNRGLIIQRSQSSGVEHSRFESTGEGSVVLDGGNRQTLAPGQLFARHNHFSQFDSLVGSYRPAILLTGVGHEASDNHITDGQHAAIIFSGNDHWIHANEISKVGLSTKDVGAIYTGRDWTGQGHRIEANYIHDLPREASADATKTFGVTAIYLDDQASGIRITNNVVVNAFRGVLIGGGRDNQVRQNVFVDVFQPVSMDQRGRDWQRAESVSPSGPLMQNLRRVPFESERYLKAYPGLKDALDSPGQPRRNLVELNAFDHIARRSIEQERVEGYAVLANFSLTPILRASALSQDPQSDCRSALWRRLQSSAAAIQQRLDARDWVLPPALPPDRPCPNPTLLN